MSIASLRAKTALIENFSYCTTSDVCWCCCCCWSLYADAYFFSCQCVKPNLTSGNHQNLENLRNYVKKIIFFSNFQAAINNFIQERGRSREDEGNKVNCKGTVWLREKTRKIGKNIGRNQTKKHIPFLVP